MNSTERNSLNTYLSSLSNALRYAEGSSENIQASEIPTRIRGLTAAELTTPVIGFDSTYDYKVTWTAVTDAVGYIVYVNNTAVMTTTNTSINLYDTVSSGQSSYNVSIRAYGNNYKISCISNNLSWVLPESMIGVTGFDQSSGNLTYLGTAAGLGNYTRTNSGTVYSVTSPLDSLWPFNSISEETINGNVFIKLPRAYVTWIKDENNILIGVKLSPVSLDNTSFIPDCFLKPGSSSQYNDYFYMGKYEASGTETTLYSKSGYAPRVSITRANARAYCSANGAGYQQLDFSSLIYYNILACIYLKTANVQNFYAGRTSTSSAANTGSCDSVVGLTGYNTSTGCVKILGVENPFGNIWKFVDGVTFNTEKIYITKDPIQYSDTAAGTYTTLLDITRTVTTNTYISKIKIDSTNQSYLFPSDTTGGSASTYYGDYHYYNSGVRILLAGGCWDYGSSAGLWCFYGHNGASYSNANLGARLCYRLS